MKAVRFHKNGGPEVLVYEDAPEPQFGDDDVLIEVKAASLNHIDLWLRRGLPGRGSPLPHIPGSDASGIVKDFGRNVKGINRGDKVLVNPSFTCGRCEFCAGGDGSQCISFQIMGENTLGSYAEFLRVPSANVHPLGNLSFEEGAAIPLTFLTAWRMLITRAMLQPGEDVLIWGVGAGVGVAALQIAKFAGARVIATASSPEKLRRAEELGADIIINHAKDDVVKRIKETTNKRGVDVVVDYIGAETWQKSLQALRKGGRIVTCGATTGANPPEAINYIFFKQLSILGSTMGSAKEFSDVLRCVRNGKLKPVIHKVMPLKDVQEAHRMIEARAVFGKLVLIP